VISTSAANPSSTPPESVLVIEVMGCWLGIVPKSELVICTTPTSDVEIDLLHGNCTYQDVTYPLIWLHTLMQHTPFFMPNYAAHNSWVILCRSLERTYAFVADAVHDYEAVEKITLPHAWRVIPFYTAIAISTSGEPLFLCDADILASTTLSLGTTASYIECTLPQSLHTKDASLLILQGWNTPRLYSIPFGSVLHVEHAMDVLQQTNTEFFYLPGDTPPPQQVGVVVTFTHNNDTKRLHVQQVYDVAELPPPLVTQGAVLLDIPALIDSFALATAKDSTILLVDDSTFFRKHIPPALMSAGYEVKVAATVQEAMRMIKQSPVLPMILVDIHMGADFLCHYQAWQQQEDRHTIIALTTDPRHSLMHYYAEHGFHGCVCKTHVAGLITAVRHLARVEI